MRVKAICKTHGVVEPYNVSIDHVYIKGKYADLIITGKCNGCGDVLTFERRTEEC